MTIESMQQIDTDRFDLLRQVFPVEPGPQTSFFFIDRRMGEAFLEKETIPGWGMICVGDDMIIRGNLITDDLLELIHSFNFKGLLEVDPVFVPLVDKCFPEAVEWERISFVSSGEIPSIELPDAEIRMLNPGDSESMISIGESWLWKYWGSPDGLIEAMPTAGCFAGGEMVSVCSIFAESAEYADLGIISRAEHRGKNYGTACTSFLAKSITDNTGKRIVWDTSCDNPGSIRIAEKLGFEEFELKTKLYKIGWEPK